LLQEPLKNFGTLPVDSKLEILVTTKSFLFFIIPLMLKE